MSDEETTVSDRAKSALRRTAEEIVARIASDPDDDFFGFRREVLAYALDFEHAKPFLNENVTFESWEKSRTVDVELEARGYLTFAVGKIIDHRGLSASRSVQKLQEYAWLMGRDDIVEAMDAAEYSQYGAPKIKAFADGLGWSWLDGVDQITATELLNMAAGQPCTSDCHSGCGR